MPDSKGFLTTKQYAAKSGLSTAAISKLLRSGKLTGQKQDGKWLIRDDQAVKPAVGAATTARVEKPKPAAAPARTPSKTYSVAQFSAMTYLTEFGVAKWLREGRLKGTKDVTGQWLVDAANLDSPDVKRLLRR